MAPIRLLIARMRTDQLPGLLIIALVFATALVAAATPRLFNRVADEGLRYQMREATRLNSRGVAAATSAVANTSAMMSSPGS